MKAGITGYSAAYGEKESLIDVVMDRTERYYNKFKLLPTIAYVYEDITDEEEKAILGLGNIQTIIKRYGVRMVLVGSRIKDIEDIKGRLDDGEEQETG